MHIAACKMAAGLLHVATVLVQQNGIVAVGTGVLAKPQCGSFEQPNYAENDAKFGRGRPWQLEEPLVMPHFQIGVLL